MSSMLNQFPDFRTVQKKIEQALKTKWIRMFPCSSEEWRSALKEFGIQARPGEPEVQRRGFLMVADPVEGYVYNARGDCIGTKFGVLYVPEEVAEKILVLGELP